MVAAYDRVKVSTRICSCRGIQVHREEDVLSVAVVCLSALRDSCDAKASRHGSHANLMPRESMHGHAMYVRDLLYSGITKTSVYCIERSNPIQHIQERDEGRKRSS